MNRPKTLSMTCRQSTAVLVGVGLMLASWVIDAALDAVYQNDQTFFDEVLRPDLHDIATRLFFMVTQLVFILYIARTMKEYRRQGARLEDALRSAETERSRSLAVLECVGDAISMQDLDLRVLYQNQAHLDLMGAHLGEYCYQAYQQKDAVCPGCHLAQSYLDGLTHKCERSAQTRRGLRFSEIISTPLRDASGRIVAGIEAVRDITERKRAELEIQRMNRELELRALELSEANRELESFGYSLSHDLRSYITRISTSQQIIAQSPQGKDRDLAYPVQAIEDSCRGMEELVVAMLTLSQLSRKEMQWEEVALSELAQELALGLRQQELDRSVEFTIPAGLLVRGDRHLLKVALENLLENAWKYTRGVPVARIELGTGLRGAKRFFYLRDNGVGFDMAERDKLFRPFQRLQSAQGFPGTGVGLATVERAIQRHGGEVWGEGEPGKGATIYFLLPEHDGR
ncbi:MAG TPA: ATP-binding protein [Geomonas sp.]